MAQLDARLKGNFTDIEILIKDGILGGSVSASLEAESSFRQGDVRCSVLVFERFSYTGGNRVSLNVTLFGHDGDIYISAVASGGSQATFFKINTFGEEAFLDKLSDIIYPYIVARL